MNRDIILYISRFPRLHTEYNFPDLILKFVIQKWDHRKKRRHSARI